MKAPSYKIPFLKYAKGGNSAKEMISLRLHPNLIKELRLECERRGLGITDVVTFVLDQFLQQAVQERR